MIKHEPHFNRQIIQRGFNFGRQFFEFCETGGILFCGDNDLRGRHCRKNTIDFLCVFGLEMMMIAKGQWCDGAATRF